LKIKLLFFSLVGLFSLTSAFSYSERSYITDDISCFRFDIKGDDSLYVDGELTYYVEEDTYFTATVYFYDIFNKVLARAYIEVTLKENDDSAPFEAPIHIDNESDPMEVKSAHHIQWKVSTMDKIECCINHGGIMGCDEGSGKLKCDDGFVNTSCACDTYHISE